jgi:hypothetical protein
MKALACIKSTTDRFGAIGCASLLPVPLAQVHVVSPMPDLDPNVAGLLPTSPRVLAFPNYGGRLLGSFALAILGGTSLIGRPWTYDTASGKWLPVGNLVTATVVGGTTGTIIANVARTKSAYLQVTTVNGAVTDLTYGFYN